MVEQVGHEYYCDCRIGIKGDLDKHCMALNFDRENFPIDPRLRAVKFGKRKRGAGRPALVGPALSKSPPKNIVVEDPYIETSQDEFEIPVIDWSELIPSSPAPSISLSQLPSTSTPSTVPTQILPSLSPTNVDTNFHVKFFVNSKSMAAHKRSKVCQSKIDCSDILTKSPSAKRMRESSSIMTKSPSVIDRIRSRMLIE